MKCLTSAFSASLMTRMPMCGSCTDKGGPTWNTIVTPFMAAERSFGFRRSPTWVDRLGC